MLTDFRNVFTSRLTKMVHLTRIFYSKPVNADPSCPLAITDVRHRKSVLTEKNFKSEVETSSLKG